MPTAGYVTFTATDPDLPVLFRARHHEELLAQARTRRQLYSRRTQDRILRQGRALWIAFVHVHEGHRKVFLSEVATSGTARRIHAMPWRREPSGDSPFTVCALLAGHIMHIATRLPHSAMRQAWV